MFKNCNEINIINDYKKILMEKRNNKFIFAPNSSGKSLFSESLRKIVFSESKYKFYQKEKISFYIEEEKKIFKSKNNFKKSWTLKLDKKEKDAFLNHKDILFINSIINLKNKNTKIWNTNKKVNLKDLIIKIQNKKFYIDKIEKMKSELSSSEYELIILIIFVCAFYNLEKIIVLDDPIELASWENERIFIEFLSFLFKKNEKSQIILLTHRISLYKKIIGLNKKAIFKDIKPDYIYFFDQIPFLIEKYSSNFLNDIILEKIDDDIVVKRLNIENVKKIFNHYNKYKMFSCELKKEFDVLSNEIKKININNLCFPKSLSINDLPKFILMKFHLIITIRNEMINDWNNKNKINIKKLSKIEFLDMQKRKTLKKNSNKYQIKHLKNSLNDFAHSSEWILWNEINFQNIINIIKNNFNLIYWKNTNILLKKIEKYLCKTKKSIISKEILLKDFCDKHKN